MNRTPPPPEQSNQDAVTRSPIEPVVVPTDPYELMMAKQKRAAHRRALALRFGIGIAAVVGPLGYLAVNGKLSTPVTGRKNAGVVASRTGKAGTAALVSSTPKPTPTPDPAIVSDLRDYLNKSLPTVRPDEKVGEEAYAAVTGANFKDGPSTLRAVEQKVIPAYTAALAKANAIQPKTTRVRDLHQLMLLSMRLRLMGYRHMVEGKDDPFVLWQFGVKAEMENANRLGEKFQQGVAAEAYRQGVELPRGDAKRPGGLGFFTLK